MRTLHTLYHMMRADFLERTRRYSFLVMLLAVVFLGYAVNNGSILLYLDNYRGVYNSAWVGALMSLVIVTFLGWFGFYLVKNTIERDEQTGVGQIIATTPLTRPQYALGKWLSNFALLAVLIFVLILAATVMQLLQREDPVFDLWALVAPFLFVALPMMALVAGLAVLFEVIPFLRGGFGNVVYFFLFMFLMLISITSLGKTAPDLEPFGIRLLTSDMGEELLQVYPEYDEENFVLGMTIQQEIHTFRWTGVDWTPGLMALRLSWIVVGAVIAAFASLLFNRFDPSGSRFSLGRGRARKKDSPDEMDGLAELPVKAAKPARPSLLHPPLPLPDGFLGLVISELRLMLYGQRWYWYAGAVVIVLGSLFSPLEMVRQGWLLGASVWPLLIWSKMGVRESQYNTQAMVFSAPHPLLRLLSATWLGGFLLTALVTLGIGLRWLFAADGPALLAWLLFALLAPSLALFFGVWSGSSKLFEVVYLLLWYIGPANRVPGLDYLGISPESVALRQPWLLAGLIVLLLSAAVWGRRRRLVL